VLRPRAACSETTCSSVSFLIRVGDSDDDAHILANCSSLMALANSGPRPQTSSRFEPTGLALTRRDVGLPAGPTRTDFGPVLRAIPLGPRRIGPYLHPPHTPAFCAIRVSGDLALTADYPAVTDVPETTNHDRRRAASGWATLMAGTRRRQSALGNVQVRHGHTVAFIENGRDSLGIRSWRGCFPQSE
jgi:hypothetical protein